MYSETKKFMHGNGANRSTILIESFSPEILICQNMNWKYLVKHNKNCHRWSNQLDIVFCEMRGIAIHRSVRNASFYTIVCPCM